MGGVRGWRRVGPGWRVCVPVARVYTCSAASRTSQAQPRGSPPSVTATARCLYPRRSTLASTWRACAATRTSQLRARLADRAVAAAAAAAAAAYCAACCCCAVAGAAAAGRGAPPAAPGAERERIGAGAPGGTAARIAPLPA